MEFDGLGRPSKRETITEPEYDVNERDSWHALQEWEDALCPQCGQLRSICEDPDTIWNPQIHGCQTTAARAMYTREWQKRHADTKPDADHWHPADGTLVWVSDALPPDREFTPELLPPPVVNDAS